MVVTEHKALPGSSFSTVTGDSVKRYEADHCVSSFVLSVHFFFGFFLGRRCQKARCFLGMLTQTQSQW